MSVVTRLQLFGLLSCSLFPLSNLHPSELFLIRSKAQSSSHLPAFPRITAMFAVRLGTIITFGLGRLYPLLPHCPLCSRETERNGARRRADIIVAAALCGEFSENACSINLQDFQHTCHIAVKNHVAVFWIMTPSRLAECLGVRILIGAADLSLVRNVHVASGAQPAWIQSVPGFFVRGKSAGT